MLGLVGVMNVVNFSDGVDGLAAGVCAIARRRLRDHRLRPRDQRPPPASSRRSTAGAALGFLVHNFHPARLHGRLRLEPARAAARLRRGPGRGQDARRVALVFPLVVLAVPFLDTTFVVAQADEVPAARLRRPTPTTSTTASAASASASGAPCSTSTPGRSSLAGVARRPALRALLRRPRPPDTRLDDRDGRDRLLVAGGAASTSSTCSRSSSSAACASFRCARTEHASTRSSDVERDSRPASSTRSARRRDASRRRRVRIQMPHERVDERPPREIGAPGRSAGRAAARSSRRARRRSPPPGTPATRPPAAPARCGARVASTKRPSSARQNARDLLVVGRRPRRSRAAGRLVLVVELGDAWSAPRASPPRGRPRRSTRLGLLVEQLGDVLGQAHQQLALVAEVEVERGPRDAGARSRCARSPRSANVAPSASSCLGRLEDGGLDRRAWASVDSDGHGSEPYQRLTPCQTWC